MLRLRFFRLVVISLSITPLLPAEDGGRFSPRKHFPERSLLYLEVAGVRGLRERLASTLPGRVITHPGWKRAFEGAWQNLMNEIGRPSKPWEDLTGKTTPELFELLDGGFALTVRGVGPAGLEVALALEMGERNKAVHEVLDTLRARSEDLLGSPVVESRVEELDVRIWPVSSKPLYEAELGSSLVLSTSPDLLRDIHAAFRGDAGLRAIEESAFHGDLEEPLSVSDRQVLLEVDLEAVRGLIFPMFMFRENADEIRQVVRLSGLGHLTTLGFALGFHDGGLECAAHLGMREGPAGIIEALHGALPAIDSLDAGLERIPARAERISVARLAPGTFLRQADKLVRRNIPELAGHLDFFYRGIEENTTISVERDLLGLEDATFFCFDIEPPAGSLFWDSVSLARTEEIEPWWNVLEKGARSFGIEPRTLETSKGKVRYIQPIPDVFWRSERGPERLRGLFEGDGPESALLGLSFLAPTLARWDAPDGWSAFSTRPRAIVRHAEHYAGEPASGRERAMAALAREKLAGASLGSVTSGRSCLWLYNTVLGILDLYSGPLALVGVDLAAAPPAEAFLDAVRPGYVSLRSTPRGLTLRGERMFGSGGLAAIGAGAIAAGLVVPVLWRVRRDPEVIGAIEEAESSAREVQCMSNLKGLHQAAYALARREKEFRPPPGGSRAWFEKLLARPGLEPANLICPESSDEEARRRDGDIDLGDENVSYDAIGWPVPPTEEALLFFDDRPRHGGQRTVILTTGLVRKLPEPEFQRRLAEERRRYGGDER